MTDIPWYPILYLESENINMKKQKKEEYVEDQRVYVFHNTLFNFNLFINAEDANEAMEKFDQCCMAHREHWKVFVELKEQPSE